ncbi:MAG TPA: hypothetical protein VKT32_16985 [Chthonomonadaceae bacterium]|nr:hypothetical protein [Chthonomonadaceae bacterium]
MTPLALFVYMSAFAAGLMVIGAALLALLVGFLWLRGVIAGAMRSMHG